MNSKLIIFILIFLFLFMNKKEEKFSETMISFQDFMNNHYGKIFPRKGYDQKAKNSVIMRHLNRSNILFIRSKKINISSSNIRKRYLYK